MVRPVGAGEGTEGEGVNPDVIEAMCRAYWDERGSTRWKNEGEQYRESIRCRMRAAVKVQTEMTATKSVLAPVSAPNHGLFPKVSLQDALKVSLEPLY